MKPVKTEGAALTDKFRAKLESSGLTLDDATQHKFQTFTSQAMATLGVPEYAGFRIPYFDTMGRETEFYRVRYLEDTRKGFLKQTESKGLRYAQPKDSLNEVYMSPQIRWDKQLKDAAAPLFITEGELKAIIGCKHGLPTVGLGGVWMFRSAKKDKPLLDWFYKVEWKGKKVYIVYDSDAISNANVVGAENALCKALCKLGAVPYVVRLPMLGSKTGLDDYFLQKDKHDFAELVEQAGEYRVAEELHKMNERVIYVRDPGLILKLDTNQRVDCGAFHSHAFSTEHFEEKVETEKGTKYVERSTPKEWLKWRGRSEVEKVSYLPGEQRIVDNCINIWPGWKCEPEKGDVTPWLELLEHIFYGEKEAQTWFEQWCAYPIQFPGCKLYTSAVVWGGETGTGKSLIGYTLFEIYGANAVEIEDAHLLSNHNEWAENRQFVMGDEITGGDKRGVADRMKSMITRRTLRLNPKYIPSYTIPDCINYYFTSNHPDAFYMDDKDRRYFVHEVKRGKHKRSFYDNYMDWFRGDGPSHLFYHLLNLDMKGFHPHAEAMMTLSKQEMIDGVRSDIARWVNNLKEDPDGVLRIGEQELKYKLWTLEDLLKLYDPQERTRLTLNGLSRELKKAGIEKAGGGQSIRFKAGKSKMWILRDIDYFTKMTIADIGKTYDNERKLKHGK